MTEAGSRTDSGPETPIEASDLLAGPDPALVARVADGVNEGRAEDVREAVAALDPADIADLMGQLGAEERHAFLDIMRERLDPLVLTKLGEDLRDEAAAIIGTDALARTIVALESDDALYLIEDLEETRRRLVLHAIPAALRGQLEEQLAFPEESAGRLMSRDVVAVPEYWTIGACIDDMRESEDLPDSFYDLFVVDARYRPIGTLPLDRLVRSKREVKVADVMDRELYTVQADMDQEEVAYLFKQHDLTSAPVVDGSGRLIGTITVDDVVDVIEEEAEEDMLHLGLVPETDLHASAGRTAPRRVRWLLVTALKAVIASGVIAQFQATIEQMVALAVLMPIASGMAGDAGMQAVTVTVRGLATRELTSANLARFVGKEIAVGAANGLFFALLMGVVAGVWFESVPLGIVLGAAMVFNMVWAALAGTLIPATLVRFGVDPAIASGPFLVTTTDVLGFFSFLGLASWLLL